MAKPVVETTVSIFGVFGIFGSSWIELDRFGTIWIDLDQFGSIWVNLDQFGTIWINLNQFGSIWIDLDQFRSGSKIETVVFATGLATTVNTLRLKTHFCIAFEHGG